jgi:uncharacterized membrane protein
MTIQSATTVVLSPQKFAPSDIAHALGVGWHTFRYLPGASMAFASVFALIGLILLTAVGHFNASPMALPFAGGFMLVGPALLTGFFRLAAIADEGRKPRLRDALASLAHAPTGLWLVAAVCALLFLIWITDAAVLYAFMIGAEHLPYELPWLIGLQPQVTAFELWAALMGSVLAFIIFAISAFSVPLLHEGRAHPVQAISTSVRAVLGNFLSSIAWGLVLTGAILISILLLPLLTIVLPMLAYSSFALYRKVFPLADDGAALQAVDVKLP